MPVVDKQEAFLAAFKACANLTKAAEAVGIDRSMHYRWMKEDAEYKAAFEEAVDEAAQTLEDEAVRRATEGVEKPVMHKGHRCYESRWCNETQSWVPNLSEPIVIREYSDTLMVQLLKAFRPQKYRENVKVEGDFTHRGIASLSDAELERIVREAGDHAGTGGGGAAAPADQPQQDPDVLPE